MKNLLKLSVAGLVLAIAPAAMAYIPPATFIIKNMATKRTGAREVRISSTVLAPSVSGAAATKAGGPHFKVVTIYDTARRLMRSEAFDTNGAPLYSIVKKGNDLPLSLQILYDPYYDDIIGALRRQNIPVVSSTQPEKPQGDDIITLQRWNNTIAWALGLLPAPAGSPMPTGVSSKSDSPQLWIEKDSFLPIRVILGDQDVQFTNYRYSQALPYPRTTILFNRAGVEQLEENIQSFQINPSASAIKTMWLETGVQGTPETTKLQDGFTSAGESSPLKDLIRAYYAGIR